MFYDLIVMGAGAVCVAGAVWAARDMVPGRVRYVGLVPRAKRMEGDGRTESDHGVPELAKLFCRWREHVGTGEIDDTRRQATLLLQSGEVLQRLAEEVFLASVRSQPSIAAEKGLVEQIVQHMPINVVLRDLIGPEINLRRALHAVKHVSPELLMMVKGSEALEEQHRKIRNLERRIRQLEERSSTELSTSEEQQEVTLASKAVH